VNDTYRISEIFHSLQGEGPSAGTPAIFVRLQGCDVGCAWCDSRYTWPPSGGEPLPLDAVLARARAAGAADLLVVTGGEPLEHQGIAALLERAANDWPRVEIETSGIAPPPFSAPRLHYNVSPKLPSATPRWEATWAQVPAWNAEPRATFKIVVGGPPDETDALRLIDQHRLPRQRVMLMPEGITDARVRENARRLADVCRREGLRLSPRLHVWMWGAKRGV
jgi:7-carboxy-7-deazaguanine synthase